MNPFAVLNGFLSAAIATAAYYHTHPLAYLLALIFGR